MTTNTWEAVFEGGAFDPDLPVPPDLGSYVMLFYLHYLAIHRRAIEATTEHDFLQWQDNMKFVSAKAMAALFDEFAQIFSKMHAKGHPPSHPLNSWLDHAWDAKMIVSLCRCQLDEPTTIAAMKMLIGKGEVNLQRDIDENNKQLQAKTRLERA